MTRIVRRPSAERDLLDIWTYVAGEDDAAADRLLDRFEEKLVFLADHPLLGRVRPELAERLRSFAVGNYILFYRPVPSGVELVRVLHAAREFTRQPFD